VTTTINIDHPLFNTRDERLRIQALLRHMGSGADLREFAASPSEKVALVKTANQRGLIAWHKARDRYELTPVGWCELAPSRRFGVGSMMLGTTAGATLGAAALAVFWFTAGAAHGPAAPRPVVKTAPAQIAQVSTPAAAPVSNATPGAASPVPASAAPPSTAAAAPTPAAPTAPAAAAPAHAALPAAAPVEPEPKEIAPEPTREQLAEDAKAKKAAAKKEKARQRAAARRKREEAARAWAGDPWRTRQAEYSGHGVYGYGGGYSGQNSWFAYR